MLMSSSKQVNLLNTEQVSDLVQANKIDILYQEYIYASHLAMYYFDDKPDILKSLTNYIHLIQSNLPE